MDSSPIYIHRRLLSSMSEIIAYCEELQLEANRQGHHFLTGNLQRVMAVARRAVEFIDRLCVEGTPAPGIAAPDDDEPRDEGTVVQAVLTGDEVDAVPTGIMNLGEGYFPGSDSPRVVMASPADMEDCDFPTGSIHLPSMASELLGLSTGSDPEEKELSENFLDFFENPQPKRRAPACSEPLFGEGMGERDSADSTKKVKQCGSVLVVDDSVIDRNMLARRLFGNGFAVCTAEGGYQALETLASHDFDVVVLDLLMADMDGFAVIDRIRKKKERHRAPHHRLELPW